MREPLKRIFIWLEENKEQSIKIYEGKEKKFFFVKIYIDT